MTRIMSYGSRRAGINYLLSGISIGIISILLCCFFAGPALAVGPDLSAGVTNYPVNTPVGKPSGESIQSLTIPQIIDRSVVSPEKNTLVQPGIVSGPGIVTAPLKGKKSSSEIQNPEHLNQTKLDNLPDDVNLTLLNLIDPMSPPVNYTYIPGGPLWDGYNHKPAASLSYNLNKKLLSISLKSKGYSDSEIQQKMEAFLPPPPRWQGGFPSKGNIKAPVILLAFPDQSPLSTQTTTDVNLKMFGNGDNSQYPYDSLANYYLTVR